jgi:penicillin-binding protein 1A
MDSISNSGDEFFLMRKQNPLTKTFFEKAGIFLQRSRPWFAKAVKAIWILFFCVTLGIPLYIYAVTQDLFGLFGGMPSLAVVENPENDLSSELISADGVSLGRYFRFNRSQVRYDDLPQELVTTLLVSEDHRFYEHSGMDLYSYLRVLAGVVTFSPQGGGSTLTQQTGKNLFSTRGDELQGTLARKSETLDLLISKTKEWIIAVRLERSFTKQEIIAMYLNTVPFNNNAFGIKVAAETYFSKSLNDLALHETALLIGMLQGTHRFNPIDFPERALAKRNEVLTKLYAHQYIKSSQELDSVRALPLSLKFNVETHDKGIAVYFKNVLRSELFRWSKEHGYDLLEAGLKIHTTLDSRMQRLAEEAMEQHMQKLQGDFNAAWGNKNPWVDDNGNEIKDFVQRKIKRSDTYRNLVQKFGERHDSVNIKLNQKKRMRVFTWKGERDTLMSSMDSLRYYNRFLHTGLMAMHPATGEIKAWVGGINYKYFQFDHVRQGARQPGSTFKPFVYGKAMEDGFSPCYGLFDISPSIQIGSTVYHPKNSDGAYGDGLQYSLRRALAKSLNSITIQMMKEMLPENVASFAQRLGIKSKLDPVLSLGLGTSDVSLHEMVSAYCSFVNLGIYVEPYYITRIEDRHGNVIANFVPTTRQAMSEETAYKMIHMLRGGVEEDIGTSRILSDGVKENNEIGAKTGTTDNGSDGWFMGITHDLVTGVWVGGDERNIHFPNWGAGSGGKTALPIFDLFMSKVYKHPEIGFRKGMFRRPLEFNSVLDCDSQQNEFEKPDL